MPFKPTYFKHGDLDAIFDERGSSFLTMRRIQWGKEGEESNPDKAKLELRKWTVNPDGEVPLKGFSFLTEEGPHNLAEVLVSNGFGSTKTILRDLKRRDDFKESVLHINDDEDSSSDDGEYFDMRDLLLGDDDPDKEETA